MQRLAAHLREPLHRNGYALVASTFSTSILGFLYWAIAARAYSLDLVGTNGALISLMMFLTNIASLNFTDVLNRFVPVAGPRTRRLVDISYAIAVGLGGVAAVVFLLGRHLWTPRLNSVLHGRAMAVFFVVAVMFWVVFVLQDAVLIGLRRATYVLAENTAFGVVKIVLLLAFAAFVPATGIFLSWTVPLVAVVAVISMMLFRTLIPQHQRDRHGAIEHVDVRAVTPFLGADYVASVAGTTATSLMPLFVLASSGASASGYVLITWTVAYSLYLVSRNIGMALTTEGATDPQELTRYTRMALAASARIVVPIALALAIGAPWFLQLYGSKYAAHAAGLLRLFALSAIPAIVPTTVAAIARVQRRLKTLVVVTCVSTLPALALVPVFTHFVGLAGAGLAWLVVQTAVALVLMTDELRHTWRPVRSDAIATATAMPVSPPGATGAPDDTWIASTEAAKAAAAARAERARRRAAVLACSPAVSLGLGALLWAISLTQIDARRLGSFGLVSNLPVAYYAGIALVGIGFVVALHRGMRTWVLAAHGVLIALMLHATPAITYAELRYAWAWKHIGVIDLLQHRHTLPGGTAVLDIYRHWPGFFAAATALVDATGIKSALSFAQWGPPFFALLDAALLTLALRALTTDRRRIALTVWMFLLANWVGQEYFAPQAFGFALYLAIIAIVLRWYRTPGAVTDRLRAGSVTPAIAETSTLRPTAPQRRSLAIIFLALLVATTTSHPLTPIVVCLSLGALRVFRVLDRRWPLVASVGITAFWLVTGAGTYTYDNVRSLLNEVGRLGNNVDANLASFGNLSPAQHIVANMGRMVVVVVALLAVAGFVRRLRHGYVESAAVALCVAPVLLLAAGAYGGEAIFRAYLFAVPFAAFLASGLLYPSLRARPTWGTPVAIVVITAALTTGTLFAYFGKDAWSDFTPSEVAAARVVYGSAPAHSLLIDGTLAYPTQFEHVDRFTYVTLSAEPSGSVHDVLSDPVGVLRSWMTDPRYRQGYLILTRSQFAEADATGELPHGALQRIERLILAAPGFKVLYHDADALVVTVPRPSSTGGTR